MFLDPEEKANYSKNVIVYGCSSILTALFFLHSLTPTHVNVFVLLFIIFVDSEGNGIVRNANVNADQKLGASIHIKEMKLPVNV